MSQAERAKELLRLERQIERAEQRLEALRKHREEVLRSLTEEKRP